MKINYSCDVWHGNGIMVGEQLSIVQGKKLMKTLIQGGFTEVRMYVQYEGGKRTYYAFDKNGKLYKENNSLDN